MAAEVVARRLLRVLPLRLIFVISSLDLIKLLWRRAFSLFLTSSHTPSPLALSCMSKEMSVCEVMDIPTHLGPKQAAQHPGHTLTVDTRLHGLVNPDAFARLQWDHEVQLGLFPKLPLELLVGGVTIALQRVQSPLLHDDGLPAEVSFHLQLATGCDGRTDDGRPPSTARCGERGNTRLCQDKFEGQQVLDAKG